MAQWFERMDDGLHDDSNIKGFFGEYRWLSNYEPCLVEYEGITYQSSEAAFQAAKCANKEDRKQFIGISAAASKVLGRQISLRNDWEKVKLQVMEDVLTSKFNKNAYLRRLLIETGTKFLEETNWWNDTFWGVCKGVGTNHLGIILMKIRSKLK